MILQGRSISGGKGEGRLILLREQFSFLGGLDSRTGKLTTADRAGECISGKVLAFTRGKGSTVGSYVMLDMGRHGSLPVAIINQSAEPIVSTGAVMARVPMVDGIDLSLLEEGDQVLVDGDKGTVALPGVSELPVVTSILRHDGKVLLLRRSEVVGSYRGMWAGISGYLEEGEEPAVAARREIQEEVGATELQGTSSSTIVRVRDGHRIWLIHAFLFDVKSPEVRTDWEHVAHLWIPADEVTRYEVVPGLLEIFSRFDLLRR